MPALTIGTMVRFNFDQWCRWILLLGAWQLPPLQAGPVLGPSDADNPVQMDHAAPTPSSRTEPSPLPPSGRTESAAPAPSSRAEPSPLPPSGRTESAAPAPSNLAEPPPLLPSGRTESAAPAPSRRDDGEDPDSAGGATSGAPFSSPTNLPVNPPAMPALEGNAESIHPSLGPSEPTGSIGSVLISGRVLEAGSRNPIEDAIIVLDGTDYETVSEEDGRFQFEPVPAAAYSMTVVAPSFQAKKVSLDLASGRSIFSNIYLFPRTTTRYAMTVETIADDDSATQYSLTTKETQYIPGTFGDALRAIENLPGMNRAPYSLGWLIIRGGYPNESGYFVEGNELPLIYHFLGISSAIAGEFIDRIDYLPGGFGASYGRKMGGIVNVELVNEFTGPVHGNVEINPLNASIYLEGSGKSISAGAAFNLSYIQKMIGPAIASLVPYSFQAPRFTDSQFRVNVRLNDSTSVRFTALQSSDSLIVYDQEEDAVESGDVFIQYDSGFDRLIFQLETYGKVRHQSFVSVGHDREYFAYGDYFVDVAPNSVNWREELELKLRPSIDLKLGLDCRFTEHHISIFDDTSDSLESTEYEGVSKSYAPALFTEIRWKPLDSVTIQPGLRVDYMMAPAEGFQRSAVDPRFTARWQLLERSEFIASVGRYSQFPSATEFFREIGNPYLYPSHGVQMNAGLKQQFKRPYRMELTGYYNRLDGIVVLDEVPLIPIEDFVLFPENYATLALPSYSNDGRGKAYGLELMVQRNPKDGIFGWAAYTLNRSLRQDHPNQSWYPAEYDQTQILTLFGSKEFPKNWVGGIRFRYATGNPFTSDVHRVEVLDTGGKKCVPDPSAGRNTTRLKPYHTLDARVQKLILHEKFKWNVALELQNAYNRKNVEVPRIDGDCTETHIYGLPILPYLELRGEF